MIHVEIGGKKRPFSLGMNALAIWCKLESSTVKAFTEFWLTAEYHSANFDPSKVIHMVYAGLADGYRRKAGVSNPPFTVADVGDWLDNPVEGAMTSIMEYLYSTLYPPEKIELFKKALDKLAKPGKKKVKRTASKITSTQESSDVD